MNSNKCSTCQESTDRMDVASYEGDERDRLITRATLSPPVSVFPARAQYVRGASDARDVPAAAFNSRSINFWDFTSI
jgi:hypothetical protein